MPELSTAVFATSLAQTISAAILTSLLFGFLRQHGKSYLAHWTAAWAAAAVQHLAGSIGIALALWYNFPPNHPARVAVALVAGVAGYLQIGWLMFGVYELLRRRPVRIRAARWILSSLAVAGVLTAIALIDPAWSWRARYFVRVGLRALLAGVAYIVASWGFWSAKKRRLGFGFTLTAVAFLLYGLEEFHYVGLSASAFSLTSGYATSLAYLDFLLQAMTGMGMIACLLEDEREASELATVEIEHLAYHDALTGLPNRPLFVDRLIVALAQANRAQHKLAVLFLDLDRFKDINDSLGHSIGDTLLKAVADRIRRCVREGDTVARFGGDEFTLLIPRIENI